VLPARAPRDELGDPVEAAAHRGELLGVDQAEVQEQRLRGCQIAVEAAIDCIPGDRERRGVVAERLRGAAVDVARELVEQDHEAEAAARRRPPRIELAARRGLHQRGKLPPDLVVDLGASAEPQRLPQLVVVGVRIGGRVERGRQRAVREPVVPDARQRRIGERGRETGGAGDQRRGEGGHDGSRFWGVYGVSPADGCVRWDVRPEASRHDWKAALEGLDAAAHFHDAAWLKARPLTTEWREYRALIALRDGLPEPWKAVEPELGAEPWQRIVAALRERKLLTASRRTLTDEASSGPW